MLISTKILTFGHNGLIVWPRGDYTSKDLNTGRRGQGGGTPTSSAYMAITTCTRHYMYIHAHVHVSMYMYMYM